MNPFFNAMSENQNRGFSSDGGNFFDRLAQFKQSFGGGNINPQQEVYKMLQSGRINQEQLNQVQNQARSLYQQYQMIRHK